MNELQKHLSAVFSNRTSSLFQRTVRLQQSQRRLTDVFEQFAKHLLVPRTDPQFYGEVMQVEAKQTKDGLITLRAFGNNEIRLCLDIIQTEDEVIGRVTCFWVPAHELAQRGQNADRKPMGSWDFDDRGETEIKLGTSGNLFMTDEREAVALAVGVLSAVYSRPVAASSS